MADAVDNLVFEQLRFIRSELASVKEDTREIKTRMAVVESGIASLRRDNGDFATTLAVQHVSYDRIDRIERRLDLADAD